MKTNVKYIEKLALGNNALLVILNAEPVSGKWSSPLSYTVGDF